MKKYVKITIIVALTMNSGVCFAQDIEQNYQYSEENSSKNKSEWDYYFKLGAGWSSIAQEEISSNVSSETSSKFAWRAGAGIEYIGIPTLGLAAELEFTNIGHKLKSNFGGLTGSSDFIEKITYSINYLSITSPKITWHNGVLPVYVGLVSNYKLGGTRKYNREGTGLKSVDDSNGSSIDNLCKSIYSIRFGFGDKHSIIWGDIDIMLGKSFDVSRSHHYVTTTFGVCF